MLCAAPGHGVRGKAKVLRVTAMPRQAVHTAAGGRAALARAVCRVGHNNDVEHAGSPYLGDTLESRLLLLLEEKLPSIYTFGPKCRSVNGILFWKCGLLYEFI